MNRILLSLFCLGALHSMARAEGPAILVCDLQRVTEECDEALELVATLKRRSEEKRGEFQNEVVALQTKQKELLGKKLSERDLKWYEEYRLAVQTEAELKSKAALFNVQMQDDIARKIDQLMKGARQESQKIMRERGASMVLISKLGPMKFENDQELKDEAVFRRVLCVDPAADITEEVMKRMNAWWKEHKKPDGSNVKREEDASSSENSKGTDQQDKQGKPAR